MTRRAGVPLSANAKWNYCISFCDDNDNDDDKGENVNITELWKPVTLPTQLFTVILRGAMFP